MCNKDFKYSLVGYAVIGVATPAALVMMFSLVCHIAVSVLKKAGVNEKEVKNCLASFGKRS